MSNLAKRTKGRFYNVTNPKALPRIYQKEARSISRPLIFEQTTPWLPKINYPITEPVMGLPEELPAITGLVLTSPKENELVEIPIVSPLPTGQLNPVLAHWTYGLGRSVAFTSDTGRRWAKSWPDWRSYAAFWSQVIRWSMRPADRGNFTLNVRRDQGRIKVVVDALDKNNEFLNFLQIQGSVVDPDLKPSSVELVQVAPGRYEGTIENAEASGNYFVTLRYRGQENLQGVISSGVSVPYSDEYRELRSNPANLETVATLTDGQVVSTKATADGRYDLARTVASVDHFRRDPKLLNPRSFAALWPTLLMAGGMPFLGRCRRPANRARYRLDQAHLGRRMEKAARVPKPRRRANTWTNSKAAKRKLTSSSTAPARAARAETSAILFPEQASSSPIGEPILEGGSPARSSPDGTKDGGPEHGHRLARDRETKLYRPFLEGETARLGRTGERQGTGQERTQAVITGEALQFWRTF